MRVLVTGGAGYIGSHTCKALAEIGHEPIVVDNLVNGHEWAVKWGPFHNCDLRDTESLLKVLHPTRRRSLSRVFYGRCLGSMV